MNMMLNALYSKTWRAARFVRAYAHEFAFAAALISAVAALVWAIHWGAVHGSAMEWCRYALPSVKDAGLEAALEWKAEFDECVDEWKR